MPISKPHDNKNQVPVPSNKISNTALAKVENFLLQLKDDKGEVIAT